MIKIIHCTALFPNEKLANRYLLFLFQTVRYESTRDLKLHSIFLIQKIYSIFAEIINNLQQDKNIDFFALIGFPLVFAHSNTLFSE